MVGLNPGTSPLDFEGTWPKIKVTPPHHLLPLKKNLNHICLDCHAVCDNVYCSLTMFSTLAAVCTVWLRYRNWLNYITLHYTRGQEAKIFLANDYVQNCWSAEVKGGNGQVAMKKTVTFKLCILGNIAYTETLGMVESDYTLVPSLFFPEFPKIAK